MKPIPLPRNIHPKFALPLALLMGIPLVGGSCAHSASTHSATPESALAARALDLDASPPSPSNVPRFGVPPSAASPGALPALSGTTAIGYQPDASSTWKDNGTALLWSVGTTVVPVWAGTLLLGSAGNWGAIPGLALFIGGLAAGPSAGQWYLGAYQPGGLGMLIRIPGMILVTAGIAQAVGSAFCGMDFGGNSDASQCPEDDGSSKAEAGFYIYLAGAAYSLIDIPFAAKRKQERESRYGMAPILRPSPQGGTTQGLMAWARF